LATNEVNTNPKKEINKEFDIDIFTNTFKKNWYWIPIFIGIFLATAFVYLRYTKPVFEARTVIQLGNIDEGKKVIDIDNVSTIGDELSSNVELLKSELILRKALKKLKLNISYYSKGDILTEEKYKYSSYQVLPIALKDSAIIGKSIHVTKDGEYIVLNYDFNGKNTDRIKLGETYENEYFKLIFNLKNEDDFERNLSENELYFIFNSFNSLAKAYHPNLSIKVINPDAKSIEIKYRSNNPVLSRDIVASIVATFFEHDFEKKRKGSANILNFIGKQLDSISDQLELSEIQIKEFKQINKVQNPQGISDNLLQRITNLEGQIVVLDLEKRLLSTIDNVLSESPDRLEVYNLLPGIVGSQFENSLSNQVQALHELMLSKDDATFSQTKKNANIKNLDKRITAQVNTIKRILSAFQIKLKIQKDEINLKILEIESSFYGLPEKEMELSRLERLFQLNEKYYVLLLEKKAQYSISKEGFTTSNLILSTVEVPTAPISPRKSLIIIAAVLLGFIVGSANLFIKYIFYNEINSPDELKKLIDYRIGFLGFIPKLPNSTEHSESAVFENPKSVVAESFRTLRSNLNFTIKDQNAPIVIGVTSTIPSEGKTFISINLGSIYSLSNKKTIIIDLDMRKPKIHLGMKVSNKKGISDVLSGKTELADVITKDNNNLYLITAGTIPPNPNELILNGQIEKVIEELKKDFDVIIIDNPPVGIVSDGIEILKLVDVPIFVVRANYSKRIFAHNISSYLVEEKLPRIYTVLNGFYTKKKDYGYSYGYGNYYHEESKSTGSIFSKIFKKRK
jgi:capsular exopolysaccharide synthesis family protein